MSFTAQYQSIVGNHSVSDAYLYALEHPEQPEHDKTEIPVSQVPMGASV
ncbi:MAG: hypothetical protein AAFY17_13780 [Cyanobacteria bacterium J06642_11]